MANKTRKISDDHYHYTNPAGQVFWIARVEVLHTPYRVEWQVGEVVDGVEQPPFDQAPTRALCVAYCQPEV